MAASTENQAAVEIKLKIITLGQFRPEVPTLDWVGTFEKSLKKCPDVFFVFVKENVFCIVKIWRSLDFVALHT